MSPNPLPIGFVQTISFQNEPRAIQTANWQNTTANSDYNIGQPGDAAAVPSVLGKNVNTTSTTGVTFILGAEAMTYHVVIDVTYVGGGKGESSLDFTTQRPIFSTDVGQKGSSTFNYSTRNPANGVPTVVQIGEVSAGVDEKGNVMPGGSSTSIKATTGPETLPSLIGGFMWIQKIDSSANITSAAKSLPNNGTPHWKQTNGYVIDNGDAFLTSISQSTVEQYKNNTWSSNTMAAITGTYYDAPQLKNISPPDENSAIYDYSMSLQDDFDTYLMYQATGGVWIAVAEYTWHMDVGANNAQYGQFPKYLWQPNPNNAQPDPQKSATPSGDAAFPTWTGQSFGTKWTPPF